MCRFGLGLEYRKRTEKWVVSGRYGRVGLGWASAEPILVWATITLSWALTWVFVGTEPFLCFFLNVYTI